MDWRGQAACVGKTNLFYPEETRGGGDPYAAARLVCSTCPVTAECREWARTNHELYGLWGNKRPQDRNPQHTWSKTGDFFDCHECKDRFWHPVILGAYPKYCPEHRRRH